MISLSDEDYFWYVDHAFEQMVTILDELGDDLANRKPDLPDANTPYAILTHCLGVLNGWGGAISGRPVVRDRDAEFTASGSVAELVEQARAARRRLGEDLAHLDPTAVPPALADPGYATFPYGSTQSGTATHILEELFQHLGHLELTRDLLCRNH